MFHHRMPYSMYGNTGATEEPGKTILGEGEQDGKKRNNNSNLLLQPYSSLLSSASYFSLDCSLNGNWRLCILVNLNYRFHWHLQQRKRAHNGVSAIGPNLDTCWASCVQSSPRHLSLYPHSCFTIPLGEQCASLTIRSSSVYFESEDLCFIRKNGEWVDVGVWGALRRSLKRRILEPC